MSDEWEVHPYMVISSLPLLEILSSQRVSLHRDLKILAPFKVYITCNNKANLFIVNELLQWNKPPY